MRASRTVVICGGLLMLGITAAAQKVVVSHDKQTDFAKYKTYKWMDSQHKPTSPFANQAIVGDINAQLAAKGLRLVDGPADLLVVYNVGTDERVTVQGYDYGYAPRMWGGGMSTYTSYKELEGKLTVDLIDSSRKELVWRGVAKDTVPDKQDKAEKLIQKSTEKMFKQYPPKG